MKNNLSYSSIQYFFQHKEIAIIGLSKSEKKFSNFVKKELETKGYKVFGVNPSFENSETQFKTIDSLPAYIQAAIILTPKTESSKVTKQLIDKGIKNIWVQQGAHIPEIIYIVKDKQVNLIYNQCILMFAEPVVSFHKFHRSIKKLFGTLPK